MSDEEDLFIDSLAPFDFGVVSIEWKRNESCRTVLLSRGTHLVLHILVRTLEIIAIAIAVPNFHLRSDFLLIVRVSDGLR